MRYHPQSVNRIRKMINAAASWRASGDPHDANQAAAALSRARAMCEKHAIPESHFSWPDKLSGSKPEFIIIDDPWNGFRPNDIPIKTQADLVREAAARRAQFDQAQRAAQARSASEILKAVKAEQRRRDALRKFQQAIRRQGFAANNTSESMRLFQEAMAASIAAKEGRKS